MSCEYSAGGHTYDGVLRDPAAFGGRADPDDAGGEFIESGSLHGMGSASPSDTGIGQRWIGSADEEDYSMGPSGSDSMSDFRRSLDLSRSAEWPVASDTWGSSPDIDRGSDVGSETDGEAGGRSPGTELGTVSDDGDSTCGAEFVAQATACEEDKPDTMGDELSEPLLDDASISMLPAPTAEREYEDGPSPPPPATLAVPQCGEENQTATAALPLHAGDIGAGSPECVPSAMAREVETIDAALFAAVVFGLLAETGQGQRMRMEADGSIRLMAVGGDLPTHDWLLTRTTDLYRYTSGSTFPLKCWDSLRRKIAKHWRQDVPEGCGKGGRLTQKGHLYHPTACRSEQPYMEAERKIRAWTSTAGDAFAALLDDCQEEASVRGEEAAAEDEGRPQDVQPKVKEFVPVVLKMLAEGKLRLHGPTGEFIDEGEQRNRIQMKDDGRIWMRKVKGDGLMETQNMIARTIARYREQFGSKKISAKWDTIRTHIDKHWKCSKSGGRRTEEGCFYKLKPEMETAFQIAYTSSAVSSRVSSSAHKRKREPHQYPMAHRRRGIVPRTGR